MFHSQFNDTTHSQVYHTINPNHVDPRDDGRVSVQDHIGLDDDDGVQLGDGHGGSTSREVDQSRTWRSGDWPPLTPPLRHSHVGSGGSSVETGSDHDGDMMDGDWERSTPGESTRGTVLGIELTDHGGSRVTLQSTGYNESPDPGDPTSPEQPRHGQLHGLVQLRDGDLQAKRGQQRASDVNGYRSSGDCNGSTSGRRTDNDGSDVQVDGSTMGCGKLQTYCK